MAHEVPIRIILERGSILICLEAVQKNENILI